MTNELYTIEAQDKTVISNSNFEAEYPYSPYKSLLLDNVICGDALSVLSTYPDECVDAIITSPPYDFMRDKSYANITSNFEQIAIQLCRVLTKGGVLAWNVNDQIIGGSETGTSLRQALFFMDVCGLRKHQTQIYLKSSSPFSNRDSDRYSDVFEYVFIFSKGKPKTISLLCDKINRFSGDYTKGRLISDYSPRENVMLYLNGNRRTCRVKVKAKAEDMAIQALLKKHTAKMPDLLALDIIRTWTKDGDIVLDPFSGTGTTAVMAKRFNRKYIAIEMKPEFVDIIHERLTHEYDVDELIRLSTKEYNSRYLLKEAVHANIKTHNVAGTAPEFDYLRQPPRRYTVEMPQVRKWIEETVHGKVLNLFAGKVELNCDEVRVDLDPTVPADYHMDAYSFVESWNGEPFDSVILDPPYNLRKARELYDGRYIGSLTKIKDKLSRIVKPGGIVISFGYDTTGMSLSRGFEKKAVCLINHSGDHNDTLIVVEIKIRDVESGPYVNRIIQNHDKAA